MKSILSNEYDESIDQSFSRRRGFRKNIKRGLIKFDGETDSESESEELDNPKLDREQTDK